MKKVTPSAGKLSIVIFLLVFASSCVPVGQLSYFNDIEELEKPVANPKTQKTILPFDRLYIRILSIDPQTREIFNIPEEARYSPSSDALIGYMVDEAGNIDFPFVGKVNVGSLTLEEAGTRIEQALGEYVANTTILVKFIDNQVSVLGEVQRQGVYAFTQEKLNVYEALALGGGLTRYGNRKNIILIRQEGDRTVGFDGEGDGRLGVAIDLGNFGGVGRDFGLAGGRGGRDLDDAVGGRLHLAGQDVNLVSFLVGQRVFDVNALGIRAAFTVALAGAAGAVATVEGNVDLGAVRGLGYKLVGVARDDAGDPVFELQGNVERHGIVLIGD